MTTEAKIGEFLDELIAEKISEYDFTDEVQKALDENLKNSVIDIVKDEFDIESEVKDAIRDEDLDGTIESKVKEEVENLAADLVKNEIMEYVKSDEDLDGTIESKVKEEVENLAADLVKNEIMEYVKSDEFKAYVDKQVQDVLAKVEDERNAKEEERKANAFSLRKWFKNAYTACYRQLINENYRWKA